MNTRLSPHAHGGAYIIAIILLNVFVALGVAMAASANNSSLISKNFSDSQSASRQAEGGVGFMLRQLSLVTLPAATTSDTAIANLAVALGQRLNGTANLGGLAITSDGSQVIVPRIVTADGTFDTVIVRGTDQKLTLRVTGRSGMAVHTVGIGLALGTPRDNAFNYGLASKGSISISGNGEVRGKNQLAEASVISTTDSSIAVSVGGNAVIDGDISSVGLNTTVVISGSPQIAGSTDPSVMANHIHFGVEAPAFPEVDTSVFRPLAVNVVDKNTNTSQNNATFENIVIKANTNPTFASDVTLNGVVYVEAPNTVTFSGKVTLNGLVASDPGVSPLSSCKLSFAGQVEAFGVDALPNLPEFTAVKQLTGTFIATPGFDVSFAGQFTTINGTIAADKLTFSGQAAGTVKGSVIGLADQPTSISGSVNIVIDRSGNQQTPAGFRLPVTIQPDRTRYSEGGG